MFEGAPQKREDRGTEGSQICGRRGRLPQILTLQDACCCWESSFSLPHQVNQNTNRCCFFGLLKPSRESQHGPGHINLSVLFPMSLKNTRTHHTIQIETSPHKNSSCRDFVTLGSLEFRILPSDDSRVCPFIDYGAVNFVGSQPQLNVGPHPWIAR